QNYFNIGSILTSTLPLIEFEIMQLLSAIFSNLGSFFFNCSFCVVSTFISGLCVVVSVLNLAFSTIANQVVDCWISIWVNLEHTNIAATECIHQDDAARPC